MRVLKKSFMSACLALALVLMLPSVNVYASSDTIFANSKDTYTVTLRPGKVGAFTDSYISNAKEAGATITTHGAIKFDVTEDASLPALTRGDITANEGYYVRNVSEWYPLGKTTVDRDMDFVVDYVKLINGIEYTIEYVDKDGMSIWPKLISQANAGEVVEVEAPEQIINSEATVYNLVSSPIGIIESLSETNNVITFTYELAPVGTVIEEVIIGEDGEIITLEEYVTTTVGGGAAAGGAGAGGAAGGGAAAGAAEGGEAAEGGNEAVEILDEETPLAGGIDDGANEESAMVEIGEEDVPLAAGEEPMANMALIGASIFGAGAVLLAGAWLFMKKKRATVVDSIEE